MIQIDELKRIDLRIAEIIEIHKDKTVILCDGKYYEKNIKINTKKGDKIVVSLDNEKLIILLADNSLLAPEKEIKEGSKVE